MMVQAHSPGAIFLFSERFNIRTESLLKRKAPVIVRIFLVAHVEADEYINPEIS